MLMVTNQECSQEMNLLRCMKTEPWKNVILSSIVAHSTPFTQTPGSSLPSYLWGLCTTGVITGSGFPLIGILITSFLYDVWKILSTFLVLHWMLIKVNTLGIKIEDLNMAQEISVSVSFLSIWSHFISWHHISTLQLHQSTSVSRAHSALSHKFYICCQLFLEYSSYTFTGWVLPAPIQVSARGHLLIETILWPPYHF